MISTPAASRVANPARGAVHPIRVLIVDDSALVRSSVRRLLDSDPDIEVVDVAIDGLDALIKVERLQPDVVTMDVEMPNLDGLAALRLLMARFPRPVIMLSSLTDHGTAATVQALALGAVDYIAKPTASGAGISAIAAELTAKVKHASQTRVRVSSATASPVTPVAKWATGGRPQRVLVIGSSTGGPRALAELLPALPGDLPAATLIVQHLPAGFTRSLAERLDQTSSLTVREASDGESLSVGSALLAPGGKHLSVTGRHVSLNEAARRHGVRPSVDITLEAAAAEFGPAVLAVILTGMGQDGTEGARAVKAAGGRVIAEAEASCVVFGMPQSVIKAGLADEVVPLPEMAGAITRAMKTLSTR